MSNYNKEMAAKMIASAPITLAIAKQLASDFSLPQSSVIAKAVQMKLYKPEAKKFAVKVVRADLVQDIEERCRLPHGNLNGLKSASGDSLKALLAAILVLEEVS
jgi:hypothetical protein